MKRGASTPFGGDSEPETADETAEDDKQDSGMSGDPPESVQQDGQTEGRENTPSISADIDSSTSFIRKRESYKSNRKHVPVFCQEDTRKRVETVSRSIDEQLIQRLLIADFREAALRAGLSQPEQVLEELVRMGYKTRSEAED
jgi:hypothetical protein